MRTRLALALILSALGLTRISVAGMCGCEKEPPDLAAVRPPFTWPAGYFRRMMGGGKLADTYRPGGEIILFSDDAHPLDSTKKYRVVFYRIHDADVLKPTRHTIFEGYGLPVGADARAARQTYRPGGPTVCSPRPNWTPDPNIPFITPVFERDQADSQYKWQLRLQLPMLTFGPKRIVIEEADTCVVWRTIDESQFTVIGQEIQLKPTVPVLDPATKTPLVDPDGRPVMKAVFEGWYPTGISGVGNGSSLERWTYIALDVSAIRGLREAPNTTQPGWGAEWGYDLDGYAVTSPGALDILAITGWNSQGWTFSTLDQVINLSKTDQQTFFARTVSVQVCSRNPLIQCSTDADCPATAGTCRSRDQRVSDGVVYWKHEFNTWADDHKPGGKYEPDPSDPAYWHRHANLNPAHPRYAEQHADFDHLIIAIKIQPDNAHRLLKTVLSPFDVHIEAVPQIRHDLISIDPNAGSHLKGKGNK